jgi:hypothetical protein
MSTPSTAPESPDPPPQRVLILGAGPIGIEAAVACSFAGFAVTIVERGASIAASVYDWGHCRLFSQNALNHSEAGLAALNELGVAIPQKSHCPTGKEYIDSYLEPLSRWLEERGAEMLLQTTAIGIGRGSQLKGDQVGAAARASTPFAALLTNASGDEWRVDGFVAVVDATGSYGNGNFLGRGGVPAVGERKLRAAAADEQHEEAAGSRSRTPRAIFFDGLPDVLGRHATSFVPRAGTRKLSLALVGSGYSAATVLRDVLELAASRGNLYTYEVHWLLRKPAGAGAKPYVELENDPLPSRAKLVELANQVATCTPGALGGGGGGAGGGAGGTPTVIIHRGCAIDEVKLDADGRLFIRGTQERRREEAGGEGTEVVDEEEEEALALTVDTLVSQVGYRPSYDLASEMRVQ